MQGWAADRAIWVRLVMMLVLLGYLAMVWESHIIPLPVSLEFPLALIGWLFLPVLFVWARLLRIDTGRGVRWPLKQMFRPWVLTATFGALAAITLFLAIGWDAPSFCQGPVPVNCVKGYQWSIDNGHYFHTTPNGTHAEISRQAYIQELGFDLRSAATFGVYAMCLAWLAAAALRGPIRKRG